MRSDPLNPIEDHRCRRMILRGLVMPDDPSTTSERGPHAFRAKLVQQRSRPSCRLLPKCGFCRKGSRQGSSGKLLEVCASVYEALTGVSDKRQRDLRSGRTNRGVAPLDRYPIVERYRRIEVLEGSLGLLDQRGLGGRCGPCGAHTPRVQGLVGTARPNVPKLTFTANLKFLSGWSVVSHF